MDPTLPALQAVQGGTGAVGAMGNGNWWNNNSMNLGGGIGDLLGAFGMMNQTNPSDAAMPYFNQMMPMMQQYMGQFTGLGNMQNQLLPQYSQMTAGLPQLQSEYGQMASGMPQLQSQYNQLMQNPTGLMNQIGSTYHSSPGYQFQTQQALNAANRAAAAGGMLGSPQEQQWIGSTVNDLANQDYYNYVNHGMNAYGMGLQGEQGMVGAGIGGQQGLYNTGLQGQQGMFGAGYNASQSLAQMLASVMGAQASNAYAGAANQNQQSGGIMGDLGGALGSILSFL